MKFNTETTTQEWMIFLQTMSEISNTINSIFIIYLKLAMFQRNKLKQSYMQAAKMNTRMVV